ncbi:MAG TPA: type II and III secretion system protein family protein [Caulobacteraceae bacterium]|nr:type II and III secretion system protein family protein [Caulobacteraceae bacterium]
MKRLLALTTAVALAIGPAAPACADVASDPSSSQTIIVPKDKSAAFRLDYPASEIVVAQPDTLSLVATTDRSFYVRGKQLGVTNILIYDSQHHLAQVVDVRVGFDVGSLQADLDAALPGESIHASNFAGGILLTGEVGTPAIGARAADIAEHYAPKAVENELTIRAGQQVQVDVRVIEAAHTAIKDLGFNINISSLSGFSFSTGGALPAGIQPQATIGVSHSWGPWSLDANLQALEQKGTIRTLARPNLVAMSGQEATFLAGGEFPVPIPNGNLGTTIQFQQFGVKLNVTPTVLPNGQIQLKVAPEVSELDPKDGINISGFQVPAISTRRASTQIQLRDGESFAIAGMFQRNYSNTINQIPGASQVPVLGALFRSSDWQKNETELVIIVTPHLTTPVRDINQLPNPLKEAVEQTPLDVILNGQSVGRTPFNPEGDLYPVEAIPPATQIDARAASPAPSAAVTATALADAAPAPAADASVADAPTTTEVASK